MLVLLKLYYIEISFYSRTLICVSQDLCCIWCDEVYVHGECGHTRPSEIVYMSSMKVYIEYVVIIISLLLYRYYNNIMKNFELH